MSATSARALLRASHPMPSVAVTALVVATALAAGIGGRAALLGVAFLCGQLSVGWSNDAIDAPVDTKARRSDKPIATGAISRVVVARCAVAALLIDVPLSFTLGWRAAVAHLVAVGLAWAYNLGWKRTIVSPLPYAIAFGLVPVIVAAMLANSPWPRAWLVVASALCGVAGHFANTVGDAAEDEMTGIRGLPQRIGPARSTLATGGFLAAAALAILVAVGPNGFTVGAVVIDLAVAASLPVVLRSSTARHRAFGLVILAVGVLVVAFVGSGGSNLTPH